jgi:adenylate cyclase
MAVETEKRFLVGSDAWRNKILKTIPIEQGYLSLDPERSVRVRVTDNEGALTPYTSLESRSRKCGRSFG